MNDVIQRCPGTVAVFDRYGIDSCCGGPLVVAEVVRRHGLDAAALRRDLTQAIGEAA